MTPTVYIIAGPTAVGKTAIAIELARRLDTEIVSADSRQCYREMTIGVAKPSKEELQTVKHYFIDELSVVDTFSAADYEKTALGYLDGILACHATAVVCGGSGLYIKALCEGLDDMPSTNAGIETATEADYQEKGLSWLQEAVATEDPEFYKNGEIQNPARLLRALTFKRSTGESIITYRTKSHKTRPFNIRKIGLDLPREILYDRINKRVDQMMAHGLLAEVEALVRFKGLKTLQTVGYSELFDFLDGKSTLSEAITLIKQHTRNYAKRQLTWFRKDGDITWFQADDKFLLDKVLSIGK
jgi:tRNA dimethylallyltransferase